MAIMVLFEDHYKPVHATIIQLIAVQLLSAVLMEVVVRSKAMMNLSSLYKQHQCLVSTTSSISVETANQ